ncbi:AraC family transcriptional regulator [Pseudonocardia oroxyli]|uniref:Regulatory helix-turn-helix protein, AraC family n=1 Tax=Pseudonocardia oroxyli TaxID=366584 RepID=A0A1G7NBZ1_PSEOR|nr:AraC family transcriptional regulator [Pseudonocardia oroxyli]SDF70849.1 regulatory helix-turn-helix protein, AraC family [Pseudonocardia oroxyli]
MEVDTRAVPARERLEYWHECVSDRFVPLLVAPASHEVQGRIRFREVGGTRVRRIAGTEHTFQRRDGDIRRVGSRRESIATIGRRCGLPDPAHFSRVFRRRFGVSPREFRDG